MKDIPLIHLYGQEWFHDEAYIVGNIKGLKDLRNAIDKAIIEGQTKVEVCVNDGEGYDIHIICNNTPWQSVFWGSLAVPYTDECANEKRKEALFPYQLIKRGNNETH